MFTAGKEITVLMQTLNTLSTPDEKLAGLCKKYAELVRIPFCSYTKSVLIHAFIFESHRF